MFPFWIKFIKVERTQDNSVVIETFKASPIEAIAKLEMHISPSFSATLSCESPKYDVTFISPWPNIAVIFRLPQVRDDDNYIITSLLCEVDTSASSTEWCRVRDGYIAAQILPHTRSPSFGFVNKTLGYYFQDLDQHIVSVERYNSDFF